MATLPSHTNILLGVSPLFHGIHDNLHFVVRDNFLTLAEHFKAHGYATAAYVGAYPLDSRFGLAQGFDVYDDEYPHRYDPHLPYAPPEPFLSRFAKIPYDGEVAYVDMEMGKLIAFLKDQGLFDETMIVLTGDHGESLGQHGEMSHGFFAYNTTIWIPLIMKVPGISSRAVDQNVSHLDIFPTICDVCGIERPDFCQGTSLLPAMEGQKLADRTIYFESKYPYYSHGWVPLMGFSDRSEKFIESPIPELHDLKKDFDERTNLVPLKKLDGYRRQLDVLIRDQSSAESVRSRENPDRETLKKLSSLGYISRSADLAKKSFGPGDDVKVLLP